MKKGLLLAFGSYIAWGFLSIFWKLLSGVDAYEVFSYRMMSTMLTMLLYFLLFGRMNKLKTEVSGLLANKSELISMILASFLISINWLVFIYAVGHGQATAASLGYYINPLFSVLLAVVFLKEYLENFTKISLAFALLGVLILTVQSGHLPIVSILLPFSFGTYGMIKKNVTLSSDVAVFVETIIVTPFVLIFILFFAKHTPSDYTVSQIIYLILSGIITAIPLLLFAEALKQAPLNVVGFVQYVSPTIQLAVAIFLFHETFKLENLYGFAAIWLDIIVFIIGQVMLMKKTKNMVK
ncbi:MAG: EamA family transporter RarD [Pseudolactococcus laudensis]|uniref:EamA family transporter RarD n=1 Tax=Pseudolactococcus laudensis TaxID=1494461 RepID=UPI003F95F503